MRAEVNGARRKVLRERKARKEIKKPNVPAPGDVSPFSLRSSRRGAARRLLASGRSGKAPLHAVGD